MTAVVKKLRDALDKLFLVKTKLNNKYHDVWERRN